ncbi:hypothetical protein BH18ACT5_BH18ACT5_13910 [soil metagenome]
MEIKHHLPQRSYTRFVGWSTVLFAGSAVVHLGVAITRDWDLAGAVSFRKPVTFAVSFALLLAAIWWTLDRLPARPRLGWGLSIPLVIGSLLETALITMQSWRGVASPFNVAEAFNEGVFSLMGITIGIVSLALVGTTIWTFIEGPKDRATRLAVRAGLVMVVFGLGLGMPLIEAGFAFLERTGTVPDSLAVGPAGAAKFPHAIAFHGIQYLILLVVAGKSSSDATRHLLTRLGVVGYALLLAWATLHTNQGRSPVDLGGAETGLLVGSLGTMLALVLVRTRGFLITTRRDTLQA